MKKKKTQVIAGALVILLSGAVIIPAHAENTGNTENTMSVSYTQPSTWEVSIPATTLSQTQEVTATVSATAMNIRPDKKLQVKIKTTGSDGNAVIDENGEFTLTRSDGEATTKTTVSTAENSRNPITEDTVIAEFEDQNTALANNTTGTLYFSAVPDNTKAGDYTGSITYVMEIADK